MHELGWNKALIGMVHVGALPGTPGAKASIDTLEEDAVREAEMLARAGFDGLIVENMHDRPYVHGVKPPEVVAAMTRVVLAVRRAVDGISPGGRRVAIGVQVLSGGNKEAIAIGQACGCDFIRCENFVFSHVADEGLLATAEAGELLRYRRMIGAEGVRIFADIKKKHASHAITADVSLAECVEAAEFFGADGVIVTGAATGKAVSIGDVEGARGATRLPVLVGSGVVPESVEALYRHADALVVGSYLKEDGLWSNPLGADRCAAIVRARDAARTAN